MDFDVKDINNLANAIKEHYSAKSPNAVNGVNSFIYFVPKQESDLDTILATFAKYGVTAYPHKSSLSPIPLLRVPYTQDLAIAAPKIFPLIAEIDKAHRSMAASATQQTATHEAPQLNISAYDREIQRYQIKTLKELTGLDFTFVSADKSPLHVKSYVCANGTDYAFNALAENNINVVGNDSNNLIVVENHFDAARALAAMRKQENPEKFGALITESIGKINGHDVYLEPFFKASIIEYSGRAIAVVNINGKSLPFYVSSGQAGKDKDGIPSGRWYPLVGIGDYWFNKMPDMMNNPYPELDQVVEILEKRFPATELKQIALGNRDTKLRHVENSDLQKLANKDFPEGVQNRHDQRVYERIKNIDVYLPAIIHAWRAPAKGYLETHEDAISQPVYNLMQKMQRKIHAEIVYDNGMVQFLPNRNATKSMIINKLEQMGFMVDDNLMISEADLMNQHMFPQPKKQQGFAAGEQKVKQKKGFWDNMRDKLQSFIGHE